MLGYATSYLYQSDCDKIIILASLSLVVIRMYMSTLCLIISGVTSVSIVISKKCTVLKESVQGLRHFKPVCER